MPKPIQRSTAQISRQFRSANVAHESIDLEKRTAELTWSTGSIGMRSPWFDEPYFEGLSMEAKSVRLGRLNNGAPLLDAHNSWSNRSVIGVVEKAWIENGEGRAVVRFSKDEDADRIFQKVVERVLRNISVGYDVHEYTEQAKAKSDKYRTFIATDWEPMEISVVPMGFDDGAKIRASDSRNDCVINQLSKERLMPTNENPEVVPQPVAVATPAPAAPAVDLNAERAKAAAAERVRASEIRTSCRALDLGDELADKLVNDGIQIDEARKQMHDALIARAKPVQASTVTVGDNSPDMKRDMRLALVHRATGKGEVTAGVREFRGQSLIGLARTMLSKHGVRISHMSDNEVAMMALSFRSGAHAMADFPYLLADVSNLIVREGFMMGTTSHRPLCQDKEVNDFKEITSATVANIAKYEKVGEGGEFKRGIINDEGERYKLGTYGRIFAITRQVLMNNDFDFIGKISKAMGVEARELEADLAWAIFTSASKMGDNVDLFHASHANITASGGSAPSEAELQKGRLLMRTQAGKAGSRPRNAQPRFLIVPAALESSALAICNKEMLPNQTSNVNTFKTQLEPIVEARLDVDSAVKWYMTADGRVHDVIETAYLNGHKEPTTILLPQTEDDCVKVKSYLDVAAKALDYRNFYRNKGAA